MNSPAQSQIEVQFFYRCPHAEGMTHREEAVCTLFRDQVKYTERLVKTQEEAEQINFCGSPTVLINGLDLENMPEPDPGTMACRYCPGGLPEVSKIETVIRACLKNEDQR